jgi:hypothetical protein
MDEGVINMTRDHQKNSDRYKSETKNFEPGNYKLVWTDGKHGVNVTILK